MLARYSSPLPASETIRLRLGLLEAAWQAMDAAMASLDEIRFDVSQREIRIGPTSGVVAAYPRQAQGR